MANILPEAGFPLNVTTTGATTLGNGNPCMMLGIYVPGVLTAQIVTLWTQTANSITGQLVVSTGTMAANAFYRIPAYFAKGITYNVVAENPALTIFWRPAD